MEGSNVSVIDGLIKQIEELRSNLVRIKVGRTYTDPEVISASQKLDHVLDEYQELVKLSDSSIGMNSQS